MLRENDPKNDPLSRKAFYSQTKKPICLSAPCARQVKYKQIYFSVTEAVVVVATSVIDTKARTSNITVYTSVVLVCVCVSE